MSVGFHIEGREKLVAQLRKLGGPALRKLARKVSMGAMIPVLKAAQANVPRDSGQLRASLGKLAHTHRRGMAVSAEVGTRRDFTFRSGGEKFAQGVGKKIDRAVSRGARLTKTSAQEYARVIEFGVDKSGRSRRKAGASHFLENAIVANTGSIINHVATELRRHVETQ
jgi:HK97 gp10 family phage protein